MRALDFSDTPQTWSSNGPIKVSMPKRALSAKSILGQNRYLVRLLNISDVGLVFEYHPFRSIRHYYKQHGLPTLSQRYHWCHDAVSGFAYIHSKNLVHHDISARNILVSSDFNLKICDFGSAAFVGEHSHGAAEFRYTFGRVQNEWERTFQYDLFCMGALFYEIILGKPPYENIDRAEVLERYRELAFPDIADIAGSYAAIIENCWYDKYSFIQELEADLPPLSPLAITGTVVSQRDVLP